MDFLSIAKIIESEGKSAFILNHYLKDSSFLSISVFEKKGKGNKWKHFLSNPKTFNAFGLSVSKHKKSIKKFLPDFGISYSGEIKIKTGLNNKRIPVLYISIPFLQDAKGKITSIAVGAINQSRIIRMFMDQTLFTSYLLDDTGQIIAHPDSDKIINIVNASSLPIVQSMLDREIVTGQQEFLDTNGIKQLGAYSLVGSPFNNIGVITQVSKLKAYETTNKLINRSAIFSLIVLLVSVVFYLPLLKIYYFTTQDPCFDDKKDYLWSI